MEQYIPKSVLVAEIEKLKGKVNDSSSYNNGWQQALRMLELSINALEVKEVDLEEEICTFFSKNPIPYEHITDWPLLKNCAIHFFELGLKVVQKGG